MFNPTPPSLSDAFSSSETDTSTTDGEAVSTFNYAMNSFTTNPYATDGSFPYPEATDFPVFSGSVGSGSGDTNVTLPGNASFLFDPSKLLAKKERILRQLEEEGKIKKMTHRERILAAATALNTTKCVSKTKDGKWDNNCKSDEIENLDGSVGIKCSCKTVSPATVVDDIGNVYGKAAEKLGKIFSAAALGALANWKYWESVLFYIVAIKTVLYIYFIYYGYKKDKLEY